MLASRCHQRREMEVLVSRTYKDQKEVKAKRVRTEPSFKRSYRDVLQHGFPVDIDCDICPDCGAAMAYERGYLTCEECNWGSYYPLERNSEAELEFADAA